MTTAAKAELPVLELDSAETWDAWLREHGDGAAGVWLRLAKKGSGARTVTYPEAVEVALCHGWIDGQARPQDESYWLQRFTPRGRRSRWSRINRDRAEALIAAGRMTPSGLAAVEAARADGRWDSAYASPSAATVPDDLQRALDADPSAAEFFATLNGANRYAILYRIEEAKRPETRARRIEKLVGMLARGERIH